MEQNKEILLNQKRITETIMMKNMKIKFNW